MPKLRRILCPTDFSEFSDLAFRYALSLAQHYRAKMFVHDLERFVDPACVVDVRHK
jgi:hypothetical protein